MCWINLVEGHHVRYSDFHFENTSGTNCIGVTRFFFLENAFEIAISRMLAITFFRPQCLCGQGISSHDIDQIFTVHIDGLVQERRNSIANALELRLSCTNPSICYLHEKG